MKEWETGPCHRQVGILSVPSVLWQKSSHHLMRTLSCSSQITARMDGKSKNIWEDDPKIVWDFIISIF